MEETLSIPVFVSIPVILSFFFLSNNIVIFLVVTTIIVGVTLSVVGVALFAVGLSGGMNPSKEYTDKQNVKYGIAVGVSYVILFILNGMFPKQKPATTLVNNAAKQLGGFLKAVRRA